MRDNDGILAWPVTNEILVVYDQFILPEGTEKKPTYLSGNTVASNEGWLKPGEGIANFCPMLGMSAAY
jgi:hypothetical protein